MKNLTKKLIWCLCLEFWISSNHHCKSWISWSERSKQLLCSFMIIPLGASKSSNIRNKKHEPLIHLSHDLIIIHDEVLKFSLQQIHLAFTDLIRSLISFLQCIPIFFAISTLRTLLNSWIHRESVMTLTACALQK
ncbi:hypothetical protein PVAP13_1NG199557 [Panicum virgatum]|uniref:Uncharacterized protein n=1 Tax=Panicum virgatum TaxID=38727 RepID=A0A8T0WS91_PANVG|nr:hypothetical protein PVAP13_1NG199557 [Panicum virgatum]